jgi:hypothetical protein
MEKEIKRPRADKREILRVNLKFAGLFDPCMHQMALYGDTDKVAEFIGDKDRQWKQFCYNHNKNRKNRLTIDPDALLKELDTQMENSKKAAEVLAKEEAKAAYDRWVAKETMRHPRRMWWWNQIAKVRKNYVEEKYAKLKG